MSTRSLEEDLRAQIASLAGESCALQVLVTELARAMGSLSPRADEAVRQCFDNATLILEYYAVTEKGHPAHFSRALQVAEQLRVVVFGKDMPNGIV